MYLLIRRQILLTHKKDNIILEGSDLKLLGIFENNRSLRHGEV